MKLYNAMFSEKFNGMQCSVAVGTLQTPVFFKNVHNYTKIMHES